MITYYFLSVIVQGHVHTGAVWSSYHANTMYLIKKKNEQIMPFNSCLKMHKKEKLRISYYQRDFIF